MDKHQVIIKGYELIHTWILEEKVIRSFSSEFKYYIIKWGTRKEYDYVWSGELSNPPLQVGDELYLDAFDQIVTIDKIVRTTYNEYIYFVNYEIANYVSEQKEEDRLDAIDRWMTHYYGKDTKFKALEGYKPIKEVKLNWFQKLLKKIK